MKRFWMGTIALIWGLTLLTGCGSLNGASSEDGAANESGKKHKIDVVLDWTPNTNHTGLYVAVANGNYEAHGLEVNIIQPGESGADQMVAAGNAAFGVSYQEGVTQARVSGVPIVSIAAVIQHNTSGFASPKAKQIVHPKDFEGKVYGGWGSPVEQAMIASLMKNAGADPEKVEIVSIGNADFFSAVKRNIDFAWIYYGWTGIEAELRNEPINMIYLNEFSEQLDYYTPVLITNENMIAEEPELVRSFLAATAEGYEFAIEQPEEAARLLIDAVPDLDPELVMASQKWISPRYQDDAEQWGVQKPDVWQNYAEWMLSYDLLEKPLDAEAAFTNDFLPEN